MNLRNVLVVVALGVVVVLGARHSRDPRNTELPFGSTDLSSVQAQLAPVIGQQMAAEATHLGSGPSQYRAGTWDSTPYHRVIRPHRLNEFMYLLEGGVRFASPDGSVLSTSAGDALFVPQGARVGWESSERVAKIYVVQEVTA